MHRAFVECAVGGFGASREKLLERHLRRGEQHRIAGEIETRHQRMTALEMRLLRLSVGRGVLDESPMQFAYDWRLKLPIKA